MSRNTTTRPQNRAGARVLSSSAALAFVRCIVGRASKARARNVYLDYIRTTVGQPTAAFGCVMT
jgi:hypothetical protein